MWTDKVSLYVFYWGLSDVWMLKLRIHSSTYGRGRQQERYLAILYNIPWGLWYITFVVRINKWELCHHTQLTWIISCFYSPLVCWSFSNCGMKQHSLSGVLLLQQCRCIAGWWVCTRTFQKFPQVPVSMLAFIHKILSYPTKAHTVK